MKDKDKHNQSPINTFDNLYSKKNKFGQGIKTGFLNKISRLFFSDDENHNSHIPQNQSNSNNNFENNQEKFSSSSNTQNIKHKQTTIEIFSDKIASLIEQKVSYDINVQLYIEKDYRYAPQFINIIAKDKEANNLIQDFETTFNHDAKLKWIKQIWPQSINPKHYTLENLHEVHFYLYIDEENISPIKQTTLLDETNDFLNQINQNKKTNEIISPITNKNPAKFDISYSLPKDSNKPLEPTNTAKKSVDNISVKTDADSAANINKEINAKIIISDSLGTRNIELYDEEITLGRSTTPININSDLVSSTHIRIWLENNQLMFEDCGSNNMGSSNGTFNLKTNQKIPPKTPLIIDEKISIRLAGMQENDNLFPQIMIIRIVPKNSLSQATPLRDTNNMQTPIHNLNPNQAITTPIFAKLCIQQNQTQEIINITKFPFKIGRSRENDYIVDEKHAIVSRQHFVITQLSNKELYIEQNKVTSRNGILQDINFIVKDNETLVLGARNMEEEGNPLSITFKIN